MYFTKACILFSVVLTFAAPSYALDGSRPTKQKIGASVIVKPREEDIEVELYYKVEHEAENYKINFETSVKAKSEVEEIKVKVEYEF